MTFSSSIEKFISHPGDENIYEIIHAAEAGLRVDEVALLAKALAYSGETFPKTENSADIPSTGGPSSLTTLLCPLFLANLNFTVLKLGVPGRPAGGIDVMAQIPGYRTSFTQGEALSIASESRYLHILADENFAPKDRMLFEFRKQIDKVNIPDLVIASILSKKLAMGLSRVGLDLRVGTHGNFGKELKEAKANARRFCEVASILNIEAKCYLSNAENFAQPYIGRGEALIALSKAVEGIEDPRLSPHISYCKRIASDLAGTRSPDNCTDDETILAKRLRKHLEFQGSNYNALTDHVQTIKAQHSIQVASPSDQIPHADLSRIRAAIVETQLSLTSREKPFPDPCGIEILFAHQQFIRKGEPLFRLRAASELIEPLLIKILPAFKENKDPKITHPFFETVTHA